MSCDFAVLDFVTPDQLLREERHFLKLMHAVPVSERHDWQTWQVKLHNGAIWAFRVGNSLLYIEPQDDAEGGRYLHIVGLEGEDFLPYLDEVYSDLHQLAYALEAKYFTFQTGNQRLARILERRIGFKPIATVYRLETRHEHQEENYH